jgi:NitT/TauT family transport system permease protein
MPTDSIAKGSAVEAVQPPLPSAHAARAALPWVAPKYRVLLAQVLVVLVLIGLWQLGTSTGILDPSVFGSPAAVAQTFGTWYRNGLLVSDALGTLGTSLAGFAIGSVAGIIVAFLLSLTRLGRNLLAPLVFLGYSAPRLALLPMLIIWLGIGIQATVVLAILVSFMDAFFPAYQGAISVDQELLSVTAMMRGSRLQVLRTVRFPSALSWVALSFSVAIPQSFGAVVFAQVFAGTSGLGYLLSTAADNFNGTQLIAGTLLVAVMAIAINWIVGRIVGHYLHWQVDGTKREATA